MPARTVDATYPGLRADHEQAATAAYRAYFRAMAEAVVPDAQVGIVAFDIQTWNARLRQVVYDLGMDTASEFGRTVFAQMGRSVRFDPDAMRFWVDRVAARSARSINGAVEGQVFDAATADEPGPTIAGIFAGLVAVRSAFYAVTSVGTFANFGAQEGAKSGGAGMKVWQVNSGNPRDEHSAMAGETVPITGTFSNGMRWPGDPAGGAANTANCKCSLAFDG